MEQIYDDCVKLRQQLDTYISDGKTYYKGYEITGYITYDYYNSAFEDTIGTRLSNFYDAQDSEFDDRSWSVHFCADDLIEVRYVSR